MMRAKKAAELIAEAGMGLTILHEGPGDLSRDHVRYDCLLETAGHGRYRCQYQSNPKVHGTPDLVSVLAAVASDAACAAAYRDIDEFADEVFPNGRVSKVISAWDACKQALTFLDAACRFGYEQDLFDFELALQEDGKAIRSSLCDLDVALAPRFESDKAGAPRGHFAFEASLDEAEARAATHNAATNRNGARETSVQER